MFSTNLIVYNEEESLPRCLTFLESLTLLKEICIVVDSATNDNTRNIIDFYKAKSTKVWKVVENKFESFSAQRNLCLSLAIQPFILYIDADETYSQNIEEVMEILISEQGKGINAVRIPTLVMAKDDKHFISKIDLDPHIRIFKNKFADYKRDVHEFLVDNNGRILHNTFSSDILNANNVFMKHFQLLKSDESLICKGDRWENLGMLSASKKAGMEIKKDFWINIKTNELDKKELLSLPESLYDCTTGESFA